MSEPPEDVREVVAVTLHRDGTMGTMFKAGDGRVRCTCGWPDAESHDTWPRVTVRRTRKDGAQ